MGSLLVPPTPTVGDGKMGWMMHYAHLLVSCLTSRDMEEKGWWQGNASHKDIALSSPEGQVGTQLTAG